MHERWECGRIISERCGLIWTKTAPSLIPRRKAQVWREVFYLRKKISNHWVHLVLVHLEKLIGWPLFVAKISCNMWWFNYFLLGEVYDQLGKQGSHWGAEILPVLGGILNGRVERRGSSPLLPLEVFLLCSPFPEGRKSREMSCESHLYSLIP